MVFYLKYRPQTTEELDSIDVKNRLEKVLSSKNLPHAFLFTGPKGLGKTSTARIVAKSINCLKKGKNNEPCNKCDNCKTITDGTNLDVIEIDGASNRGIDEIRDLREKIRLSPASSPKKVYIIDEVHMLTTEAFNALLKTLEEPPTHAVFILCTTEPQKVPATIISRCFHVTFKRASEEELLSSFKRIVKGEKLNIDEEALLDIARLSDGSFRDGAKLLEETAIAYGTKKVNRADVEKHFGTVNLGNSIEKILKSLKEKNTKELLLIISTLSTAGADIKILTQNLIENLHNELLKSTGVNPGGAMFEPKDLTRLLDLLGKAYAEIKFSVLPQIPLEIAFIEWSSTESDLPKNPETIERTETPDMKVATTDDKILKELIEKINLENKSVAALLRGVKAKDLNSALKLTTGFKFHKEKLEEEKVKSLIEKAYLEISGKNAKLEIILSDK